MKCTDKKYGTRRDGEHAHDTQPLKSSKLVYILLLILPVAIILAGACSDMHDNYEQFLEGGEKIYPAKADSAKVYPGRNRLRISWLVLADPKVKRAKVFWNSRQDSVEIAIEKTAAIDTVKVTLENLSEGSYVFEIITFDNKDHASMVTEVVGTVYGNEYESSLLLRPVMDAYTKQNRATISLGATNEQAVATEVHYTDLAGIARKTYIPASSATFRIENYLPGTKFRHRTFFKPDTLAIDTFYTAFEELLPEIRLIERVPYTKGAWEIESFSSQEPANNRAASKLIDALNNTWWIARYSAPQTNYPNHWVTVDMDVVRDVDGFIMVQKDGDRKIRVMELLTSDDNSNWTSLGDFTLTNQEKVEQIFALPARRSFRYFKMVPKTGHDGQLQPGLAEIGTYKME